MSSKAIAYLKEALRTWKGIKSPEAVFVAACKEARKPKTQQAKSGAFVADVGAAIAWFEWARQKRIVIAMSSEVVYTPDGKAVALADILLKGNPSFFWVKKESLATCDSNSSLPFKC